MSSAETTGTYSTLAVLTASLSAAVQIGKATRLIGRSAVQIGKATRLIGRSGWWGWAGGSFLIPIVFWYGYYNVKCVARPKTEAVKYAEKLFDMRFW